MSLKGSALPVRPGLGRTTAWLLPLQALLRIGEVLFPLLLAAWFGSTPSTDVYVFSYAYFTFCGALVFSAFRDSAIVPILIQVRRAGPAGLGPVLGSLAVYTLLLALLAAIVVGALALVWFSVRYQGGAKTLALTMLPVFCGHLVVVVVQFMFVSVLQAMHRYAAAAAASAVGMAVAVGVLTVLRDDLGAAAIAVAHLVGEAVALGIVFFWTVGPAGLPFRPTWERPEPVRRFARLAISHVGAQAISRMNPLLDQLFAGLLAVAGGATLLKLATDVALAPIFLLASAVLPVLLSHLSEDASGPDRAGVAASTRQTLKWVLGIFCPIAVAMVIGAEPLLRLVYLRGAMTSQDVGRMAAILTMLAPGLPAYAVALTLTRVHVAVGNTPLLLPVGVFSAGSNVLLNLLLFRWLGIAGIALATSLVNALTAGLLWLRLPFFPLSPGSRKRWRAGPAGRGPDITAF